MCDYRLNEDRLIAAIDRKRRITGGNDKEIRRLVKTVGIEAAWNALTGNGDGKRREKTGRL